jgi:flagellar hook-associated protein 2
MSVSFLGSSSGLPVDSIIRQLVGIQQQPIAQLQQRVQRLQQNKNFYGIIKNQVTTLNNNLKKITAQSVLDTDLFQAKSVSSTKEDIITASATSAAAQQTFSVEVKKLASSTIAKSTQAIGQPASGNTTLASFPGNPFTTGNFTVFVNGNASQVAVDNTTDTLDSVLGKIKALSPDISTATVTPEGKLQIETTGQGKVTFGAAGDTSNFLVRSRLNTTTDDVSGKFVTPFPLSALNTNVNISTPAANLANPVSAGSTFKINGASFDTTGKTLDQLVDAINKSSTAAVTASFNSTDGTLSLTSKKTGAVAINLEDTAGNFLQSMGLVSNTNNSLASQKLGTNAEIVLNGATLYSTTNTVGSEVSGINGLTFNLKSATVGTTATVTVGQDSTALKTAVKDFIKSFNEVTQGIVEMTDAKTGSIGIDTRLSGFRNQLRQVTSGGVSGLTTYNSLGTVGISTGSAGASVSGKPPTALVFDEAKFDAALSADPNSLKTLLNGTNGIFTQLQKITTAALATGDVKTGNRGLFQSATDGTDAKVKTLNENIARMNDRLTAYEQSLRKQFQVSDSLISQYQQQSTSLAGILNNNNNNR